MDNDTPIASPDDLPLIMEMLKEYTDIFPIRSVLQINVIVDANVILADLRWIVGRRTNPAARPRLLEVLDANTLVAYAPSFLKKEIKNNLPIIASRYDLSLKDLKTEWEKYQEHIKFKNVGGSDHSYKDPFDAPYIKLQKILDHPILSEDNDISQMGGRVLQATVIARLKDYSRDAAIEYSLAIAGEGAILISASLIRAAAAFIGSLLNGTRRLPQWIYIITVAGLALLLLAPLYRELLRTEIDKLKDKSRTYGNELLSILESLVLEHDLAKNRADEARDFVESEVFLASKTNPHSTE